MKIYIKSLLLVFCGLFFIPQAMAEWEDISPSVEITQSTRAFDRVNRVLFSYVKIYNQNEEQKVGRIKLVISKASVPVLNATKNIDGDYELLIDEIELKYLETISQRINFALTRAPITFDVSVFQENADIIGDFTASKVIKSIEGGEIKLGTGVSLVVPPNSLAQDTQITILDENIIINDLTGIETRKISFSPAGTLFSTQKPAKFVFEVYDGVVDDYEVSYFSDLNPSPYTQG